MGNKKSSSNIKNLECLNCGHPFFRNEVFCPECGQKNQNNKITLGFFLNEVFKGFTSWDAKFWRTLIPLIIHPGKITKDYIEGKRARYTNPFRFYLTTSIIFFLLISLSNTYKEYQEFTGTSKETTVKSTFLGINQGSNKPYEKNDKDTINNAKILGTDITEFVRFQKKHPNLSINQGLDSLKKQKNTLNRFFYKKANTINGFSKNPSKSTNNLVKEVSSYLSTAIFILLPIFALFLKLLYIRRKRSYIAHLIFVFHTQTVFFLLLIISLIIRFIFSIADSDIFTYTIALIFLSYFFIAMKVYYQQSYIKTIFKFLLTTVAYLFIAMAGTITITLIAFALM